MINLTKILKPKLALIALSLFLASCGEQSDTATCNDGVENQGEMGIDCGGPCPECELALIDIRNDFPEENAQPFGLAFDGENFWVANNYQGIGTNPIFKYDALTGEMRGKIFSPGAWPRNLICYDTNLCFTDYITEGKMYFATFSGEILRDLPIFLQGASYEVSGLAIDDQSIYEAQSILGWDSASSIYRLDFQTGAILDTVYQTNKYNICGLALMEGSLWFISSNLVNSGSGVKLVNISIEGEEISSIPIDNINPNITGLTCANGAFWTSNLSFKIEKIPIELK